MTRPSELIERTIYDGRTMVGAIAESRPGRFEAHTADGKLVGIFPNEKAATDAILATRRGSAP
jgi:hypothetical protein